MATDAQGRQLSEDGYYYWDGAAWQPVDQSAAPGGDGSTLSPDGNYHWDGSNWQPVQQDASASAAGAGTPTADDLLRAMNIQTSDHIDAMPE